MLTVLEAIYDWFAGFLHDSIVEIRNFFLLIFHSLINFFGLIWDFFSKGIYDLLVWAFAGFLKYVTLAYLEITVWATRFAWDTAKEILQDLGYFNLMVSAWGALDSEILGLATVLRLPEAVTIIVTAAVSKYVMRFIPFV